ncbi:hypothetical protein SRS16CHR_01794 [Variovorax sp. SRS16]|uniref:hypothetical protein n=1 Tax=Variovorax sp. SRS16 TaxID=282217 RepID=UPI001316CE2A|nr:hypothetical protein [Variovorax sp. SRS16]VTU16510.1 hypothetical protein SRS16CHR_01794 [Variovorax sp. SRS16]
MTARIYQFPDRRRTVTDIDGAAVAFASDGEVRHMLDLAPDLAPRVVVAVARLLLDESLTEQAARAGGWASLAVARQRGLDLLSLVSEYPGKFGN